jgi:hypothetical protein
MKNVIHVYVHFDEIKQKKKKKKKPVAKKPVAKKPVAKKPVAKKHLDNLPETHKKLSDAIGLTNLFKALEKIHPVTDEPLFFHKDEPTETKKFKVTNWIEDSLVDHKRKKSIQKNTGYSEDSKKFLLSDEFHKTLGQVPKLQAENLNAAFALVKYLKKYPGRTHTEICMFLNSEKYVLKSFSKPAHYANYKNIFKFLTKTGRLEKVGNDNNTRFVYYINELF